LENLGADGKKIFERMLGKQDGKAQSGFIRLVIGSVAGPYVHGNEPSDSIKGGEFLD